MMRFYSIFLVFFYSTYFYAQSGCCSDIDELMSLSVEYGVSYKDACLMCCLSKDIAQGLVNEFASNEEYKVYKESNMYRCDDVVVNSKNSFFQNNNPRSIARDGNKNYEDSLFSKSEVDYRKSLNINSSDEVKFNLANSLYNQERYDEAISYLSQIANNSKDTILQSEAYYNIGNNLIKKGEDGIPEAIEAYKKCLKINPNDDDARYNLAKSLTLLDEKNNKNQNNENDDDSQSQNSGETDGENDNDQKDSDQKDNENRESSSQNKETQSDDLDEENIEDGRSNQFENLSKEEIERILKALERQGKEIKENMNKEDFIINNSTKDW